MAPADDDVAVGGFVSVSQEVAAFEFEFYGYALPASGTVLAQGFAVGEGLLGAQHGEAQAVGHDSEDQDHSGLGHGFVGHARKPQQRALDDPAPPPMWPRLQ